MRKLRALWLRFRATFHAEDQEFASELESHLAMQIDANLRSGMNREEARRRALVKLGGIEQAKELYRGRRKLPQIGALGQDVRFAFRMLRKSPAFTLVATATLALGIGANTAVFSVIDGAVLHPLPYYQPDRLVDVLERSIKDPNLSKTFDSYSDFEEYSRHSRSFEKIAFATWATAGATLTGKGRARNVLAIPVSADFFSMLGVHAARGRTFSRADLSHGCSVVLSDSFWRKTLAASPDAIGQTLNLDHRSCAVIGVMPSRFEFYPRKTELWLLLTPDDPRPRDQFLVITFARLKSGITASQAQSELAALHKAIHRSGWQRDFTPAVDHLQDEFTFLAGRNLRSTLGLLLGAVGLVLLIASLNIASLLLGRSLARRREFAVRVALGSGRARLVRQLLVEGLMLALPGAIAGIALAVAMLRYFAYANPVELPVGSDISIDWPVLAFTAAITVASALLFSLAPAWRSSRVNVSSGLRAAGRGPLGSASNRLARALVIVEISSSLILLSIAILLMQSMLKMSGAPLGFDPDDVLITNIVLPREHYVAAQDRLRLFDGLHQHLNAVPGVEASAIAAVAPPYGSGNYEMQIEGKGRTGVQDVGQNSVSADYFRVLRLDLGRGRVFDQRDRSNSVPIAVVNEALAREYFPGADPIGRKVRTFGFSQGPWLTIVGVVATERHPELMHEMAWSEQAALYRPIEQDPPDHVSIAVRVSNNRLAASGREIERAITALDRDVPVGEVSTLRSLLGAYLTYPRFRALMINQFAGLALILAAIGLHGLLSQYVSQRRREFGLRIAIGAATHDIVRTVAIQAGAAVFGGIAIAWPASISLARALNALLFETAPSDPWAIAAASFTLIGVSIVAIAKPLRDAVSVDPAIALRDD